MLEAAEYEWAGAHLLRWWRSQVPQTASDVVIARGFLAAVEDTNHPL